MSDVIKKIGSKKDLWHLVRQGMLLQLHFDLETTGLERDFAQITAYGDAAGDIAGNYIDSVEMEVRLTDRALVTPQSAAVTRTGIKELTDPSRMQHQEAMGRIAQRFEHASQLLKKMGLSEVEVEFQTVRKFGEDEFKKSHKEKVLIYPLRDDRGNVVSDVRYHPEHNRIAYRFDDNPASPYFENIENGFYEDKDGSKWKYVEPRTLVSGYRIRWADMFWLRANLVRAGYHPSNTFFTHARASITSKQRPKNFAIDTYSMALFTHLFGPEGEESLVIGKKTDLQTGQDVPSAKLEKIMTANTRYESEGRGIRGGIRMADGSLYNKRKGHRSPAYDAMASFSVYNYCREIAPDIVREMERQSDEKYLRRVLPGADPLDPAPPVYAMVRSTYPNAPTIDPVAYIALDDRQGQMRTAMMVRLDGDLRTYAYKGKKLSDMRANDFALMMKEQGRSPEGIFRLESLRKWPGIMPFRKALETKAAGDWNLERVERVEDNFRFLIENERMLQEVRRAVEIRNAGVRRRPEPANALMEEQWTRNGFGDLDYLEVKVNEEKMRRGWGGAVQKRGETANFSEMLYNMAIDDYNFFNMVDESLHRIAVQPHPVDFSDSDEAVADFHELCKKLKVKFEKKNVPYKDLFKDLIDKERLDRGIEAFKDFSASDARAFRWKLRRRLLDDEVKMENDRSSRFRDGIFDYYDMRKGRLLFPNASRDYLVVDSKGRKLDLEFMQRQYARNPDLVQKKFEKHEWQIQFYRLSSKPSITSVLFQFADADRLKEVAALWRKRYESLRTHYLWGAPNADPDKSRWPTIDKVRNDIKRLEVNTRTGDVSAIARLFGDAGGAGEGEVYLRADEGQRILAELSAHVEKVAKDNPISDAFNRAARFEPKSGLPYDYIEYEVAAKGAVVIDVPDMHLRRPLEDIRLAPQALIVGKISQPKRDRMDKGAPVILRGEQTGRLYYAGPVDIKRAPPEKDAGSWTDFYGQARDAYVESGSKFPGPRSRDVIVVQTPAPLAYTRRNIDPSVQTVKVPGLHFDALVCPRLGYYDDDRKPTGIVLPVDYCPQRLDVGKPVRFREMSAPMGAKMDGIEGTDTGHIYESTLRGVKRMTVGELGRKVGKKEITDRMAQGYGFADAISMWEKVNGSFVNQESPSVANEEIYLLDFDEVDKNSWAYWDPPSAPVAALSYGGEPVPPSAYRWYKKTAANDFNALSSEEELRAAKTAAALVKSEDNADKDNGAMGLKAHKRRKHSDPAPG